MYVDTLPTVKSKARKATVKRTPTQVKYTSSTSMEDWLYVASMLLVLWLILAAIVLFGRLCII